MVACHSRHTIPPPCADHSRSAKVRSTQIARTRADFYLFSEKGDSWRTEWWSELDSNALVSSALDLVELLALRYQSGQAWLGAGLSIEQQLT
jgi:hypothetical protein